MRLTPLKRGLFLPLEQSVHFLCKFKPTKQVCSKRDRVPEISEHGLAPSPNLPYPGDHTERAAAGGLGLRGAQRGRPSVHPSVSPRAGVVERAGGARRRRPERGRPGGGAAGPGGREKGGGGLGVGEAAGSRRGPARQAWGERSHGSRGGTAPRAGNLSRVRLPSPAAPRPAATPPPFAGRCRRAALPYKGGRMRRAAARRGALQAAGMAAAPGTT